MVLSKLQVVAGGQHSGIDTQADMTVTLALNRVYVADHQP